MKAVTAGCIYFIAVPPLNEQLGGFYLADTC